MVFERTAMVHMFLRQELAGKVVHFPMRKIYFQEIQSGRKYWEFRVADKWRKRIMGKTHALFRLGPLTETMLAETVVRVFLHVM